MKRAGFVFLTLLLLALSFTAQADTLFLPNDLIAIEEQAFYGDTSLDEVILGDQTRFIGAQAFAGSSVTYMALPDSIQFIAEDAFEGCEEVLFECSENSAAWQYAQNYENIITEPPIPEHGPETPASYFTYAVNSDKKTCTITGFKGGLSEVVIPKKLGGYQVTQIGNIAFYGEKDIVTVFVPEGVTKIGMVAFSYCPNLQNIYLPDTLRKIDAAAFADCENLVALRIPEGVTSILERTCSGDIRLERVTLPSTIKTIGENAFYDCAIKRIKLPESLVSIEEGAFWNCRSLSRVIFNEKLTSIGRYAFSYTKISEFTLPNSLKQFSGEMMAENRNLARISIREDNPYFSLHDGVLYTKDEKTLVLCPSKRTEKVDILEGVTTIGYGAFSCCENLTEVSIPEGVTTICDRAFMYAGIKHLELPDTVKTVGVYAFGMCKLESIRLSNNLKTCSESMLSGCYLLKEVVIPESVQTLEKYSFANCRCAVYLPDHVVTLKEYFDSGARLMIYAHGDSEMGRKMSLEGLEYSYGFYTDDGLRTRLTSNYGMYGLSVIGYEGSDPEVVIPASIGGQRVYVIEDKAFMNNQVVRKVVLPEGMEQIRKSAFQGCASLEEINFPASLATIQDSAFQDCASLKSVGFASGTKTIGDNAFKNCSAMQEARLPADLQSLGASAFANCTSLQRFYYPEKLSAFRGELDNCPALTYIQLPKLANETMVNLDPYFDFRNLQGLGLPNGIKSVHESSHPGRNVTLYCHPYSSTEAALLDGGLAYRYYPGEAYEFEWTLHGEGSARGLTIDRFIGSGARTEIPDAIKEIPVTAIGPRAFAGSGVTEVKIPESVETIAEDAFAGCAEVLFKCEAGSAAWIFAEEHDNIFLGTLSYEPGEETDASCFTYKVNSDKKTCTINGFSGGVSNVVIPQMMGKYPVTAIGYGLFAYHNEVETVFVPEGVTSIGPQAFYSCASLTNVYLPESLTLIGSTAFNNCTSLPFISIPRGVKTLENDLFGKCTSLKSVQLSEGLTKIAKNAFSGCTSLTSIRIPDSVTTIEQYAFSRCTGLRKVVLSQGMKKLETGVFWGCESLEQITIPPNITAISERVFEGCVGLKDIYLPTGITSWGSMSNDSSDKVRQARLRCAFGSTTANTLNTAGYDLTFNEAPDYVMKIGKDSAGKKQLTVKKYVGSGPVAVVPEMVGDVPVRVIADRAFKDDLTITSVVLPANLRSIGERAFDWCTNLEEVEMKEGLLTIGERAFNGTNIIHFEIPDSVTTIGEGVFSTYALKSVKLPSGLIRYDGIFDYCTDLKDVALPETMTAIAPNMFRDCWRLYEVKLPDNISSVDDSAIEGCSSLLTFYCRPGTVTEQTLKKAGWQYSCLEEEYVLSYKEKTDSNGEPALELTGCYVGQPCRIVVPAAVDGVPVISVSYHAFEGASWLEEIVLPEGMDYIDSYAFSKCTGLKRVTLPSTLSDIRDNAFLGCRSLESVRLPESITQLSSSVFQNCASLESVTLPEGLIMIGNQSFAGCGSLGEISLPEGLETISS